MFRSQCRRLSRCGVSRIYPNQKAAADKVYETFEDRGVLVTLALGLTQSGKTGAILACIERFTRLKDDELPVPFDNIYVITGLSSKEWKKQTRERMPVMERSGVEGLKILHRPDLKTLESELKGKQNVLILIDEVQIACGEEQTVSKEFEKAGLLNKEFMYENDIKIVEFSATPNGNLHDLKSGDHSRKVIVQPGDGYVGAIDFKNSDRLRETTPLSGPHTDNEVLLRLQHDVSDFCDEGKMRARYPHCEYFGPRYHLVRTKTGGNQDRDIETLKDRFSGCEFLKYDMEHLSEVDDKGVTEMDRMLRVPPARHTFICLKEKARCAKTFNKEFIGVWFERAACKMGDDVVTQGLLGRATGYDDNGVSLVYTSVRSVEKFQILWDSEFEANVDWVSNSTRSEGGEDVSKGTYNGIMSCVKSSRRKDIDYTKFDYENKSDSSRPNYVECDTYDELMAMKKGYKKNFQKDALGFFLAIHKSKNLIITRSLLDAMLPLDNMIRQNQYELGKGKNQAVCFYEDGETDPSKVKYALRWVKCI